ncbi:hypothetical protein V6Z05_06375 [Leptospira venezuelensis]|uniref:hypothetical protein n=1 Tax=Leptospira venezuelensis TaxID=1958811 RepID=UPI0012FF6D98|nr:hypothetical protein [Leptospira venezuelensis]
MLFVTIAYLKFLAILFAVYWILSLFKNSNLRKYCLLIGGIYFWGQDYITDHRFPFLLCVSLFGNYSIYLLFTRKKKQFGLWVAVLFNLGVLLFNFRDFYSLIFQLIDLENSFPYYRTLGISFYSIAFIQFHFDLYKNEKIEKVSILDFFLFGSFFPISNAGPIPRWRKFTQEFQPTLNIFYSCIGKGLFWILYGFLKKILLAGPTGQYADILFFRLDEEISSSDLILGLYLNTFVIYLDFSSFADIARGSAKLFGYDLPMNFRAPFLADSVFAYLLRWNRTLGVFLKERFYSLIQYSKMPVALSLGILCSFYFLWLKISWVSLIFGGVLFVVLVLEYKFPFGNFKTKISKPIRILTSFHIWVFLWMVVRFNNWKEMENYFYKIIESGPEIFESGSRNHIFIIFGIVLLSQFLEKKYRKVFL